MLDKNDICRILGVQLTEVAYMHSRRILPEPIRIDGECFWREGDIAKFKKYLKARAKCRARGIDPDSERGPSPPVYSTVRDGMTFDPRLVVAAERERERQQKSRTLRAGTQPIQPQERIALPEVANKPTKVEG